MDLNDTIAGPLPPQQRKNLLPLSLAALGVVYGDIGTSPLYAVRQCFLGDAEVGPEGVVTPEQLHLALDAANLLGILSLILWSLVLVVSVKYVLLVMRADNRGEGGVLALMALARRRRDPAKGGRGLLVILGLFGAALLYGDGMITPAISVLSAVEGLKVVTPLFSRAVIPITLGLLVGLFMIQRRGSGKVGTLFGPVILLWFAVLSVLGVASIVQTPAILAAVNPLHAVRFFVQAGWTGFTVLSAVFLVVTGAEALYADMGHFGLRPIRLGWFYVAFPGLVLNYFGQGALLLRDGGAIANPFYLLAPHWARIPLVVLATAAAVIASQAMISGAFSLTRQAVQLGYMPRLAMTHTSSAEIGQIYVPVVNWVLLAMTCWLVVTFGSSSELAGAYGVAVSMTMVITTLLVYSVARDRWKWRAPIAFAVVGAFLVIDGAFLASNFTKIAHGGWFPLLVGAVVLALLTTWQKGRTLLAESMKDRAFPFAEFVKDAALHPPLRVPGTAVFMTGSLAGTPSALLHNIKNNRVLHETVILLQVVTEEVPHVVAMDRVQLETVAEGFHTVVIRYGFMDVPNVPYALQLCKGKGIDLSPGRTSFFLGRDTFIPRPAPGMALWRKKLFVFMARNAQQATAFFRIPPGRVVEIGAQVEL